VTDAWVAARETLAETAEAATADLSLIEAPNQRAEAAAVALAVREGLTKPGQSIAVVTRDATLARRDLEGPFVNVVMRAGDRDVAMHLRNEGDGGQRLIDATAGGVARIGFACEQALVLPEGELARTGREETA
ncbi:MAG: hypothetical protein AAFZ09_16640, partial [Pseudomonadota bacterium]